MIEDGRNASSWHLSLGSRLISHRTGLLGCPYSATFAYDGDGDGFRRTAQQPGQALTTFVWDGSDYLGEIR